MLRCVDNWELILETIAPALVLGTTVPLTITHFEKLCPKIPVGSLADESTFGHVISLLFLRAPLEKEAGSLEKRCFASD